MPNALKYGKARIKMITRMNKITKLLNDNNLFWLTSRKILKVSFILLFISTKSYSQKKISYEVTEETYYELTPTAELGNILTQDLILMKPSKEKYKITREIKANKIEETKEYLVYDKTEAWLPDIKRIVTNNEGTKIYNSKGELIFEREHPLEVKNALNEKALKKDGLNEFYEIPDINQLRNDSDLAKSNIKELSNSKISINRSRKSEIDGIYLEMGDTEEIELDNINLTIKSKVKNDQGHEKESEDIYLKKLPGEKTKALKNFERLKLEHSSYADIYKVKYTLYDNYFIDDKPVFNDKKARTSIAELQTEEVSEISFKAFPNPSQNELTIYYSNKLELLNLELIGTNGIKNPITIISQGLGEIKLDVSKIQPGTYIINLQHSAGRLSQKIVKN